MYVCFVRIVCVNAGLKNPELFGQPYIIYSKGDQSYPGPHTDLDSIGRVFGISYSPQGRTLKFMYMF